MLNVYIHDGPSTLRFVLAGELKNGSCQQLDGAWRTAMSIAGGKQLVVDTTGIVASDPDGEALLARLRVEGASIVAQPGGAARQKRCLLGRWLCREFA